MRTDGGDDDDDGDGLAPGGPEERNRRFAQKNPCAHVFRLTNEPPDEADESNPSVKDLFLF